MQCWYELYGQSYSKWTSCTRLECPGLPAKRILPTKERNDGPEFVRDVVVLVQALVAPVRHTLVYCLQKMKVRLMFMVLLPWIDSDNLCGILDFYITMQLCFMKTTTCVAFSVLIARLEVICNIIAPQKHIRVQPRSNCLCRLVLCRHARPYMTCYKFDKALEWALATCSLWCRGGPVVRASDFGLKWPGFDSPTRLPPTQEQFG